jgi:hypothetical protein
MAKREVRELDELEYARVTRIYGLLATALVHAQGLILARNKFVDANILEVLDTINELRGPMAAEPVLVEAWKLWCQKRDLTNAAWPVTIFKGEIQGALALVERAKGGAA